MNYYSFADNRTSLNNLVHALKRSCALTLALKYGLRTQAKVFKRYKNELISPSNQTKFWIPKTFKRTQIFNTANPNTISPFKVFHYKRMSIVPR